MTSNFIPTFGIPRMMTVLSKLSWADGLSAAELNVGMDSMDALRDARMVEPILVNANAADPREAIEYILTDRGRAMLDMHGA